MEKTPKISDSFKKAVEKTETLLLNNYYQSKNQVDEKFRQFVNGEIDFMELSEDHRFLLLVCGLCLITQKSVKNRRKILSN